MPLRFSFKKTKNKYMEEITRQHEDGNFFSHGKNNIFYKQAQQGSKNMFSILAKIHVFTSQCNFLLIN